MGSSSEKLRLIKGLVKVWVTRHGERRGSYNLLEGWKWILALEKEERKERRKGLLGGLQGVEVGLDSGDGGTCVVPQILLHIIAFLGGDAITLYCLQIVSSAFLRLLGPESNIWQDEWYDTRIARPYKGRSMFLNYLREASFRQLLQRDGRCEHCRRWNNANEPLASAYLSCKFSKSPKSPFSSHNQDEWNLGQQGAVKLCEHVQITWASIQAHIDTWRQQQQQRGGDWQVETCLDSFNIECHDASHDTRCAASEAPTWPQARLRFSHYTHNHVSLILKWKPHCRIDALALTPDGKIPAPQLRRLFQRLRRLGPADALYPPSHPGALPEMGFFGSLSGLGAFVHYKTGDDNNTPPSPGPLPPIPEYSSALRDCRLYFSDGYGMGNNGRLINIKPHYLKYGVGTGIIGQCLVMTYAKDIKVCETQEMRTPGRIITPTGQWLHAMDTRTYPHPQASHIRPQCRDETCINYYRRRRDYCPRCPSGKSLNNILSDLWDMGRDWERKDLGNEE